MILNKKYPLIFKLCRPSHQKYLRILWISVVFCSSNSLCCAMWPANLMCVQLVQSLALPKFIITRSLPIKSSSPSPQMAKMDTVPWHKPEVSWTMASLHTMTGFCAVLPASYWQRVLTSSFRDTLKSNLTLTATLLETVCYIWAWFRSCCSVNEELQHWHRWFHTRMEHHTVSEYPAVPVAGAGPQGLELPGTEQYLASLF